MRIIFRDDFVVVVVFLRNVDDFAFDFLFQIIVHCRRERTDNFSVRADDAHIVVEAAFFPLATLSSISLFATSATHTGSDLSPDFP